MSLLPSILCFFLSFMLHCVPHVFFVPSFLSFFLSPPPTSLLVYLNYLEEHSALPQLPLKDTLREGPSYLWHLSLAHSNKALSGHHIARGMLGAHSSSLLCIIFRLHIESQELPFQDWGKWGISSGTLSYSLSSPYSCWPILAQILPSH